MDETARAFIESLANLGEHTGHCDSGGCSCFESETIHSARRWLAEHPVEAV